MKDLKFLFLIIIMLFLTLFLFNCGGIWEAAIYGNISDIKKELDKGVDVNKANNQGFTPLLLAAYYCRVDTVNFLLSKGADPNGGKGRNIIYYLSSGSIWYLNLPEIYNLPEIFELLLGAGADPNVHDEDGNTPMHLLVYYFYEYYDLRAAPTIGGCIKVMIKYGAKTDIMNNMNQTPEQYATYRIQKNQQEQQAFAQLFTQVLNAGIQMYKDYKGGSSSSSSSSSSTSSTSSSKTNDKGSSDSSPKTSSNQNGDKKSEDEGYISEEFRVDIDQSVGGVSLKEARQYDEKHRFIGVVFKFKNNTKYIVWFNREFVDVNPKRTNKGEIMWSGIQFFHNYNDDTKEMGQWVGCDQYLNPYSENNNNCVWIKTGNLTEKELDSLKATWSYGVKFHLMDRNSESLKKKYR